MSKKSQVIEDGVLVVRPSDEYRKSNNIIASKYRSTLVENKLLNISLSKINELKIEDIKINGETVKVYTSTMYSSELTNGLNVDKAHLSTYIKSAYKKMAVRQIGIEDDQGNFTYRNLFIGADYSGGIFKLYYNPLLTQYYKKLEKSYTKLSLQTMLSFKSIHALRLYELLKKECYIKGKPHYDGQYIIFEIPYPLGELKLSLGIINADAPEVRSILDSTNPPDYEKAAKAAKEQKFSRSNDFKTKCIEPAIEEINALCDNFQVSYVPDVHGQGGKLHGINFTVKELNPEYKESENAKGSDTESGAGAFEIDDFIDEMQLIINENIRIKDLKAIAEKANYNIDVIREKYELSRSQDIDNLVAWMIKAIEDDYKAPVKSPSLKKKEDNRAASFNNFEERGYEYYNNLVREIMK